MQLAHGLVGIGLLAGQLDEFPRIRRQEVGDEGLVVLQLVAASAEIALHIDIGAIVPRLALHSIGIGIGLRLAILTADILAVGSIEIVDAIALEDDILASAADDERLQTATGPC